MTLRLLAALALVLVLAAPAPASEERPTLAEIENEVFCPTCKTLLAISNAPVAERMRAFVSERIEAGDTKSEILDALVAEFGEGVLAAPPKKGFNVLAWALPIAGGAVAAVLLALAARRWSRSRPAPGPAPAEDRLDPELERRLDEELARFDA